MSSHHHNKHSHGHEHKHDHEHESHHERRTLIAVVITAITMVVEIVVGYHTRSLALLSDGWHSATHVFALGLTLVVYVVVRRRKLVINRERALALSGFASALILQVVAVMMVFEAIQRMLSHTAILFADALPVAVIGLVVNAVCAVLLHSNHHHDHNIRAAYLHVLADSLTSLLAIAALVVGYYLHIQWLDWMCALVSAAVITVWAVGLLRQTTKVIVTIVQ